MDDSIRAVAAGPADDIIARIMSEIEDVIGLIQSPPTGGRLKPATPRTAEGALGAASATETA